MTQAEDTPTGIGRQLEDAEALADVWRLAGRWEDALALLRGLDPVASELGGAAVARQQFLIGRILIDQGMFGGFDTHAERETTLDRALTHAQAMGDAALLAAIWDAKGLSLHVAYLDGDRSSEPEHELEYFERGLALRQQAGDRRDLAESFFHVGLVYGVLRHDHTQALPYFQQSYQVAQAAGDQIMESYAIRHIAFAHYDAGDIPAARAALEESLRLRETAGFVPGVAMALMALAYAVKEHGERSKALALLERAKQIFESLGATPRVALVEQEMKE
jgi:tetratricopeptide (TPR) repeat protein